MSIKTILVPIDGSEAGKSVLETARLVGLSFRAHLDVLHVQADSKEAVPLLGEGMSGAMIEEMIELADEEAVAKAGTARKAYDSFIGEHDIAVTERGPGGGGLSAAWLTETGREDDIVARLGRVADLIITARPGGNGDKPSMLTANAVLFETGQPVLFAPPEAPASVGKRIAVSWNGSVEGAKAVSAAMPFLTGADEVTILTVTTEKAVSRIGPEDFSARLAWHGIDAGIVSIEQSGKEVAAALLERCREAGADLLVMGAYTHSRVVQILLGGVTRHVLANAEIAVLMAH